MYESDDKVLINNVNPFFGVALENLDLARECRRRANEARSTQEHGNLIVKGRQYAFVTIVFAAMTLEAYINFYSARKRTRSFLKKYLDFRNFVVKWVIIPELFTGVEFPTEQHFYQSMVDLKKLRDGLVHSEPFVLDLNDEKAAGKLGDSVYETFTQAEEAVQTVLDVIRWLTEVDPEEWRYLHDIASRAS